MWEGWRRGQAFIEGKAEHRKEQWILKDGCLIHNIDVFSCSSSLLNHVKEDDKHVLLYQTEAFCCDAVVCSAPLCVQNIIVISQRYCVNFIFLFHTPAMKLRNYSTKLF